jgi:hypothetical protein
LPNNEWGDFQTPAELAGAVIRTLPRRAWSRVLEPTCGEGSFLAAAAQFDDAERIGIELQEGYARQAQTTGAQIIQASIFDLNLGRDLQWRSDGPLLVVGNPPWVTSADLGAYGSINLPQKSNVRNLRGIDALTGASNFDIAEFIWLKLIIELSTCEPLIALLCKTQVARNVLSYCFQHHLPVNGAVIRRIDAKRWFAASVDACLFTLAVGGELDWQCPVYPALEADQPETVIGFANGQLVADLAALESAAFADGSCPLEWRQGVKHDAASIMELTAEPEGKLVNKLGGVVDVEQDYVFPLLKATDLHRDRLTTDRRVILTQRALSDDTAALAQRAPRLWCYLLEHAAALDARKSSVYRARGRFAMFGVGDYTFAPWKVAISGLHKTPEFRVVGPVDHIPVVLDDTCYFLPLESRTDALLTAAVLRSPSAQALLRSLTFTDSKRPITKRLLQRVDLTAVIRHTDVDLLLADAAAIDGPPGASPSRADLAQLLSRLEDGRLALTGI